MNGHLLRFLNIPGIRCLDPNQRKDRILITSMEENSVALKLFILTGDCLGLEDIHVGPRN